MEKHIKKFIDIEAMSKIDWKDAYLEEAKSVWRAKWFFFGAFVLFLFV